MSPSPIYSRLGADPVLGELVDLFVQEMPERIAALQAQASQRDWGQLARIAHQLKGAVGSYGFDEMTPPATRLEAAARAGREEREILDALDEFLGLCQRARSGAPPSHEASVGR